MRSKNDTVEAEKLMSEGQKLILKGERMMDDPRPAKWMQGSRTMMRGLRMMRKPDANTADRLMKDGRDLMADAATAPKD